MPPPLAPVHSPAPALGAWLLALWLAYGFGAAMAIILNLAFHAAAMQAVRPWMVAFFVGCLTLSFCLVALSPRARAQQHYLLWFPMLVLLLISAGFLWALLSCPTGNDHGIPPTGRLAMTPYLPVWLLTVGPVIPTLALWVTAWPDLKARVGGAAKP